MPQKGVRTAQTDRYCVALTPWGPSDNEAPELLRCSADRAQVEAGSVSVTVQNGLAEVGTLCLVHRGIGLPDQGVRIDVAGH